MPDTPTTPLFTLRQLGLSYRARPVLRGIDWVWQPGEHWAVLGPNGAGKSTLATVLSGEQTHYAGDYQRSETLRRAGVAFVCFERGRRLMERDRKLDCAEFESNARDVGTRVRQLLPVGDDPATWEGIVDLLDLRPLLDRGLRFISTGEMRKTLLASALLARPGLLILDSPLDGLDVDTQHRFGAALNEVIAHSPAVLLLCRSADEVPRGCNRLMLLDRGRVLDRGEAQSLLAGSRTRELLAAPSLHFRAPPAQGAGSAQASPSPTIELRNVTVSFGDLCVFRDLNWRLERQQHCVVAGPNGCGKSTLLDLLTGDNHKAYGQEVLLFGQRRGSGESVWEIKRRFGRVDARMQFAVPSGSEVLATVVSGFYDSIGLRDRPSDRQRSTAMDWLRALDLAALAGVEFHTLSFGMQRLVLLARAMVKQPSILLLDEATLGLDGAHRRLLLEAVDHLVAEAGCQLLFVSHTVGELPRCINQRLQFEPREDGSRVTVTALPERA